MKTTINEQFNFKTIDPEQGMVLTDWDKKDIREYSSYRTMCTPMTYDESTLREITEAEDERYKNKQRELMEREEKERRQ